VTRDLIAKLADLRDRRGISEAGFQRGMEKILSNLTGRKRDRNLTALKITHNSEDHEERAPTRRSDRRLTPSPSCAKVAR
jgi:hypothetical protein